MTLLFALVCSGFGGGGFRQLCGSGSWVVGVVPSTAAGGVYTGRFGGFFTSFASSTESTPSVNNTRSAPSASCSAASSPASSTGSSASWLGFFSGVL